MLLPFSLFPFHAKPGLTRPKRLIPFETSFENELWQRVDKTSLIKRVQRVHETLQDSSKMAPRRFQDGSKTVQDGLKRLQDAAQRFLKQ